MIKNLANYSIEEKKKKTKHYFDRWPVVFVDEALKTKTKSYWNEKPIKYMEDGDPLIKLLNVYRSDMEYYKQSKMMVIWPFFLLTMTKK